MSFFNTIQLEDQDLLDAVRNAETQNNAVLELFRANYKLTPSKAHNLYCQVTNKRHTPLTSIRRAISDLTNEGRLEKTDQKVRGIYGKPEYKWIIKHPATNLK